VAPWSLQTGQTVDVCVVYNESPTNCLPLTVVDAHPGVFTVDGYYAAAWNQDGTFNSASNPAMPGTYVTVWATGLGPISPAQADGAIVGLPLPVNVLPVTMSWELFTLFGGLRSPITVQYAGPAPFEVAGVSQINFVVPYFSQMTLQAGPASCTFQVYVAP